MKYLVLIEKMWKIHFTFNRAVFNPEIAGTIARPEVGEISKI